MRTAIEASGIQHSFAGNQVLSGVSLRVRPGEIWGLLGPSGAGKTTLLRILTGQLRQSGGIATLLGTDTRRLTAKERSQMGLVLDNAGLYKRLTVRENMRFFAEILQAPHSRIDPILDEMGLLGAKRTPVARLSKGMRARLAISRAILARPAVLFADEPTSSLDPATMRDVHAVLRKQAQAGTTIVLTTHNMVEASALCGRIALLSGGRIIEEGAPRDICARHDRNRSLDVTLRNGTRTQLPNSREGAHRMARYMEEELVQSVHSTEPTLEDVFVQITGKGLDQPCETL